MKVCVIGAGTMGSGIAQTFAQNGFEVCLYDIKEEFCQNGLNKIAASLDRLVKKEKITEEKKQEILSRFTTATKVSDVKDLDIIVEAALENMEIKKKIFAEFDAAFDKNVLFTSNTSSLSVTEMSQGLSRPVIGMHFFNPAPVMELIEVVIGENTPDELVDRVIEISKQIGKTPVKVKENAGFVVNRILIPMINEAIGVLADGTASAEDIDTAMKLGANHKMGPLALADLIGLDIILAIMNVLLNETNDPKYRPHPLLKMKVRAGHLGVKTKKGFYTYEK